MCGAKVIVSGAVSVAFGFGSLVLAGALEGARAAVLPALTVSQDAAGPTGAQSQSRGDGLLHRVQSFPDFRVIVDEATGIRVGIPFGMVGSGVNKDHGRNWEAPDRRLSIDALRFVDRTVEGLLSTFRGIKGRRVSRYSPLAGGFILEGTDGGGNTQTAFYIEVRSQGGEIRGLSIVHATRFRAELYTVIEQIKRSFVAFPAPVPPPPPPQVQPPPPPQVQPPPPPQASPPSQGSWNSSEP